MNILDIALEDNIATKLDKDELDKIADIVIRGYNIDKNSRADWDRITEEAMKIAKQELDRHEEGRSNLQYPLIPLAALQFAARAYPEVIRNEKVVYAAYKGTDPNSAKEQRAKRISDHMSWQLLVQNEDWEPSFDKLLHVLAIVGTVFKKIYYNPITKMNCSELCLPEKIFIHAKTTSLSTARRITHEIEMYDNDIIEMIRYGQFVDISEDLLESHHDDDVGDDPDAKSSILEQHCYLDLDEDGYKEPYIVHLHKKLEKILSIKPAFDKEKIQLTPEGKVKCIPRVIYFADFHFLPNPDGSFYSIGFGQQLLHLNKAVNALFRQLIDAGTLANMPCGFVGRGFRGDPGDLTFRMGEFKKLDVTGGELKDNIVFLPQQGPSDTLFQLLGTLVQSTKELAAVSDVLQGQQPAQNVPATTVLALIEQGLKLYSSLIKRLFRSLTKEFRALYRLNAIYLDDQEYFQAYGVSSMVAKEDYSVPDVSVYPVSDPSLSSDAQRIARARALMEIMPMVGPAGQQQILATYLDALQTPTELAQKILQPAPQQPDPKMIELQAKQDVENKKLQLQSIDSEGDTHVKAAQAQMYMEQANFYKMQAIKIAHDMKIAEENISLKEQELFISQLKVDNDKDTEDKEIAIDARQKSDTGA